MKKIIFVIRKLSFGGVEKALIEMIKSMNKNTYDITVLVLERGGELEYDFEKLVKVIYLFENEKTPKNKFFSLIKKGYFLKGLKLALYISKSYFTKDLFKSYENISKTLSVMQEKYDIAISYYTPISLPVFYTINNIKATKKILWIHFDISRYKEKIKAYDEYYGKYNDIFVVSKTAFDKFINEFPQYYNKTKVYYNHINYENIKKLSNSGDGFENCYDGIRILTVARLSHEKGLDFCINIVKKLLKDNFNIKWYLIGEGKERKNLEEKIKENNLINNLILMGAKNNPYVYMKQCDIYVQPSRDEGYCIALSEAKCFNKPIVTTNFSGALEQIIHRKTGLIVQPKEEEIFKALKKLILDSELRILFESNLEKERINEKIKAEQVDLII